MVRRDAIPEYVRGSLWVLPTLAALVALATGSALTSVDVGPEWPLAFQGTADDARSLLTGIASTMVTVIALLLGLAVVALQLSSVQFSPRLLRNFLRDRPNQIVLSVFVGTFAYSAGGLFTVGVYGGARVTEFPRFAVTMALVLLFASLGLLVYFADHLAHSIQVDAIMQVVEQNTLRSLPDQVTATVLKAPAAPPGAAAVPAPTSGYVQTVHVGQLLTAAVAHRACIRLRPRVGEHVVAGTTLAWVWPATPGDPEPAAATLAPALDRAVRIGFERTMEQDAAFGLRQLTDVACKALSPAVNDPYTAVQAIDHLAVIFATLVRRPCGDHVEPDADGVARVVVPGWRFPQYLAVVVGLIRRYGAREPTVVHALLRLLRSCAALAPDDDDRWSAIDEHTRLLVAAAEGGTAEPADLAIVYTEAEVVRRTLADRRAAAPGRDA
jgi:Predicted membrane protein